MVDPSHGFWSWSLPCGRLFGIDIRLHWSLLAFTLFQIGSFAFAGVAWYWWPVVVLTVPLCVLLHEFGHSLTARAVGGDSRSITLWALGGIAWCDVPGRALAHFLTAAGGPLVNLVLWGAGLAALHLTPWLDGAPRAVVTFVVGVNGALLLFNLLPCYPMDGGRIARAILWPLVGRLRAVRWTIVLAWVCLAGMAVWGLWFRDLMLFALALLLAFAVFGEQRAVAAGYDPEGVDEYRPHPGLLARWRARRAAAADERVERHMASEQAELDRLLAKVSAGGLPSLSAGERRMLQRISEREREKAGR